MDLHDGDEAGVQVVRLRLSGVENFHWVCSPWDGEDWGFVKVLGEFHGVQGRRGHDQLHVSALLDGLKLIGREKNIGY